MLEQSNTPISNLIKTQSKVLELPGTDGITYGHCHGETTRHNFQISFANVHAQKKKKEKGGGEA